MSRIVKLAVMGRGSVGKSCLAIRFIEDHFNEEYIPTYANTYSKTITLDGRSYSIDILDPAGMESISTLNAVLYRERECFLFIYSVVDQESFNAIRDIYKDVVRIKEVNCFPCVLCANKVDLESRVITEEQGRALARELGANYFETSAKTGLNVRAAIENAVRSTVDEIHIIEDNKSCCGCLVL